MGGSSPISLPSNRKVLTHEDSKNSKEKRKSSNKTASQNRNKNIFLVHHKLLASEVDSLHFGDFLFSNVTNKPKQEYFVFC